MWYEHPLPPYCGAMNAQQLTRRRTVGALRLALILAALASAGPIAAQSSSGADPLLATLDAIARGAVDAFGDAVGSGSGTVRLSIDAITYNGAPAAIDAAIRARLTDELFAAAQRSRRTVRVLTAPGTGGDISIAVSGTSGPREALFVVQYVDRTDGAIVASTRFTVPDGPAVAALFGGDVVSPDTPDSPDQALPIALDSVIEGLALVPDDQDWFRIDIPAVPEIDGLPSVVVYTTGPTDTYIEAYGFDDPTFELQRNDDFDSGNARVEIPIDRAGTIWIKVRGFADSQDGPYDLHVETAVAQVDAAEPDNSIADAQPYREWDDTRTIEPMGDADYYRVDLNVEGVFSGNAWVFETESDFDTTITLYAPDGTQLGYDDDGGAFGNARLVVQQLDYDIVYVAVRGYGSNTGPYRLLIDRIVVQIDEFEPDDSFDSASFIVIDNPPQSRSFSSRGDVDVMLFEVSEEESRAASSFVFQTYGDIDTTITLFDEFGDQIDYDDDSGQEFNARIERRLRPGTYYLRVEPLWFDTPDAVYEVEATSVRGR